MATEWEESVYDELHFSGSCGYMLLTVSEGEIGSRHGVV